MSYQLALRYQRLGGADIIESVWSGRIYYTPSAFFDIVPDRLYKQKVRRRYSKDGRVSEC